MYKIQFAALLIALFSLLSACNQDTPTQSNVSKASSSGNNIIVPGVRVGDVTLQSDYEGLVKTFGKDAVTDDSICDGAECVDKVLVTYIHKGADNELIVYWADSAYHQQINFVEIDQKNSPYHTTTGLGVNTNLKQLEAMNGAPIKFYGFEWDYGGEILSANGGKIDSLLQLTLQYNAPDGAEMNIALAGESELLSNDPIVQHDADKIIVDKVIVYLNLRN